MLILAIDTSFDDTAAAVVDGRTILSTILSTDLSVHHEYGGVVPRLARQLHEKNIDAVISLALKRARVRWEQIDAIAVTRGPGLAICLEIGIAKAKELALLHGKQIIAVNHMEGHLLSFLCTQKRKNIQHPTSNIQSDALDSASPADRIEPKIMKFVPFLGILISGGHTQFVYARAIGDYEIVGETQDDALGEAYDKVGRMLGLGYPAGPFLEKIAREGRPGVVPFPVPMRQVKSADTSYSGLKTAAMRIIEQYATLSRQDIADIALGFQTAAITHLLEKLGVALAGREVHCLVAGGGVVKNLAVRKALRKFGKVSGLPVYFPPNSKLCTDNAAMIGVAAALHPVFSTDLDRLPTWRLGALW